LGLSPEISQAKALVRFPGSGAVRKRLKAAVVAKAQRVIVPVDHSKVGLSDFVKVYEFGEIDALVTDQDSEYLETLCRANGVQLIGAGGG
jgi:DeoR/GlpR family transcriptional regulator of sugar metabolism